MRRKRTRRLIPSLEHVDTSRELPSLRHRRRIRARQPLRRLHRLVHSVEHLRARGRVRPRPSSGALRITPRSRHGARLPLPLGIASSPLLRAHRHRRASDPTDADTTSDTRASRVGKSLPERVVYAPGCRDWDALPPVDDAKVGDEPDKTTSRADEEDGSRRAHASSGVTVVSGACPRLVSWLPLLAAERAPAHALLASSSCPISSLESARRDGAGCCESTGVAPGWLPVTVLNYLVVMVLGGVGWFRRLDVVGHGAEDVAEFRRVGAEDDIGSWGRFDVDDGQVDVNFADLCHDVGSFDADVQVGACRGECGHQATSGSVFSPVSSSVVACSCPV